jgi:hypothetical protein
MTAEVRRRSAMDVILTVVLLIGSIALGVGLFSASVLWVMDPTPNPIALAIGAYGPLVLALVGLVLAVIGFIRKRTTFIYPLVAIVLGVVVWWIAGVLVTGRVL